MRRTCRMFRFTTKSINRSTTDLPSSHHLLFRDEAAVCAHLQQLGEIFPHGTSFPSPSTLVGWSTAHTAFPGPLATQRDPVRLSPIVRQSPPLCAECRPEGNLINKPENATQLLLVPAIERNALAGNTTKEIENYNAHCDDELWRLHHIMTGGPSHVVMVLETETDLRELIRCTNIHSIQCISSTPCIASTPFH